MDPVVTEAEMQAYFENQYYVNNLGGNPTFTVNTPSFVATPSACQTQVVTTLSGHAGVTYQESFVSGDNAVFTIDTDARSTDGEQYSFLL